MKSEAPFGRIVAAIGPHPCGRQPLRGLTLVELLIAITVVGLLAAIALPAYHDYRHQVNVRIAVEDIAAMSLVIGIACANQGECPAALPASMRGKLDPWRRPYRYLALGGRDSMGPARKDLSLVPINSDFDLYSAGPDGVSWPPLTAAGSLDDIVRANDGKFVGVASDYGASPR